jgi:hypothetical protein
MVWQGGHQAAEKTRMTGLPDFFAALMAVALLSLKDGLPFGKSLAKARLVAAARKRRMVFFMVG